MKDSCQCSITVKIDGRELSASVDRDDLIRLLSEGTTTFRSPKEMTNTELRAAAEMHMEGYSLREVAASFGVNEKSLNSALRRRLGYSCSMRSFRQRKPE